MLFLFYINEFHFLEKKRKKEKEKGAYQLSINSKETFYFSMKRENVGNLEMKDHFQKWNET